MMFFLGALGLLAALPAQAQFGNVAAYFQTLHTSPRVHALGEATVALRGYSGAVGINPATIGRTGLVQLGSDIQLSGAAPVFQSDWYSFRDQDYWIATPSLDVKVGPWAAAYQFKRVDFGDIEYRNAQNQIIGTFAFYDQSHKLSVARAFGTRFSLGAGVNLIEANHPGVAVGSQRPDVARGVSFDFGAYYEHPVETKYVHIRPSVGWSLTDFGPRMDLGRGGKDPLPMAMRGGLSLQAATAKTLLGRPLARLGLHGALTKALVGADDDGEGNVEAYGPLEALIKGWKTVEIRRNPLNELEGQYEQVDAFEQMIRHRGVELSLLDIVTARFGRYHAPEVVGGDQYSTWGWGLDLYYLALERSKTTDYVGRRPAEDLNYWRLTARIPIGDTDEANFWPKLIDAVRGR